MTINLLDKGLSRNRSLIASVNAGTMRAKGGLFDIGPSAGVSQLENFREASADRARYALFKGWIYSAINAIASEAAGQPTQVARLTGSKGKDEPSKTKSLETYRRKMSSTIRQKAAKQEFELLLEHPLIDLMEQPNPIQTRWSFTYSFVANLNLTGWGYIVGGETDEGQMEFYALPTSWVRPDHTDGPFSKFRIVNPKNPTADMHQKPLTRANVGFAYLPNPADPLSAYAPAASQMPSIRIDDHIQSCQEVFFQNGVFPSVIVTIGKDPHPDAPGGGLRPRLSGAQRRQVTGAIRKVMSGVANYGNPAIVDGLIENIERLSATQNEIGWDKSEGTVRTRILSALGVHPYILGEPVGVGGYAQVANIEKRFYKRVNTYLDMLSSVMTNFVAPKVAKTKTFRKANGTKVAKTERLLLWWEQCEVSDPPMRWSNLNAARTRGDVSRNEIRVELGLPPDDTGGDRTKTFTASDVTAIVAVQNAVAQGALTVEQAKVLYTTAFDLSEEDAVALAGKQPPKPAPEAVPGAPPAKKPPTEEEAVEEATKALKDAVSALGFTASDMLTKEAASEIFEAAKFNPYHDHLGRFARGPGGRGAGGSSSGSGGSGSNEGGTVAALKEELKTAPPPGKAYRPDVDHDSTGNGITDAARVGVPAESTPPPPTMQNFKMPGLTPEERTVEESFMKYYESDPDGVARDFLQKVVIPSTKPGDAPTFGTDDAKMLHKAWSDPSMSPEQRATNRATLNVALHQTANAITKRAFLQHLDTLKPGDEVLVTVGGCGAGKGYALKQVPEALAMKQRAKAVWDSAGDQNATENPWIQKELEARGLKGNYLFVHADPYTQWAHPERGVVKRAHDPADGRMVDAKVFADSYAVGAKNHATFAEQNKNNPNANFIFLANGSPVQKLDGVPESALKLDRKQLAEFAIKEVNANEAVAARVKRGGTVGTSIWPDD